TFSHSFPTRHASERAQSPMPDPADMPDVDAAGARLERALARLEKKAAALKARSAPVEDDLFAPRAAPADTARIAELETAAREASAALGRAADEVRALLDAED